MDSDFRVIEKDEMNNQEKIQVSKKDLEEFELKEKSNLTPLS